MSENAETPFTNRVAILADLWINFRQDEEMADFFAYNDLGLPLAYLIDNKIAEPTTIGNNFINETFELLLKAMAVSDKNYETLDDLLTNSEEDGIL